MNAELIKIFCNVFNIPENSEDYGNLLSFYENSKRDITEKDFRFVCTAMRKATETAKVRLSGAKCSSEDFRELLSAFIKRYTSAVSIDNLPIITHLAEYAATGKVKQSECGIFAELKNKRTFPLPYSGSSERIEVGDILLTLSYGNPLGGNLTGDICAILSPTAGQPIDDFIEKATCVCRNFANTHPYSVIKAATEEGLLSDLSFLSGGYIIDTRLLPVPSESIEAIFDVRPPAVLLFPKREDLHELWMISAIHGLTPSAPVASRAKSVTVRSGDSFVEFTKDEIASMSKTADVCLDSCDTPVLRGETEIIHAEYELKHSPYALTAVKIGGGHIYETLAETIKDDGAVYAVVGVIDINDPSALPLIVTLDSFRKNCSPNIIYSRFFIAESTSLYVFKLVKKK